MPVAGGAAPVVLRIAVAETFRPSARGDRRELGIETGAAPWLMGTP
ncbi:MAG TPA: hypothetical protein PLB01_13680 [Thermoanaerobaculia bacterium]|nr:hypothetical protein [Thermoanaerobaculia bacterium]